MSLAVITDANAACPLTIFQVNISVKFIGLSHSQDHMQCCLFLTLRVPIKSTPLQTFQTNSNEFKMQFSFVLMSQHGMCLPVQSSEAFISFCQSRSLVLLCGHYSNSSSHFGAYLSLHIDSAYWFSTAAKTFYLSNVVIVITSQSGVGGMR